MSIEVLEVKIEEVNELIPAVINNSISKLQLLLEQFIKKTGITNYKYVISNKTKEIIQLIIKKYPIYFETIEKLITNIVKDDKIDSYDIPDIIILIKMLYEIIYNLKEVKLTTMEYADTCKSILYIIIYILVEEKQIHISDDKKDEFLKNQEKLIDVCIKLILLPSILKQSNCFTNCFGYFCCYKK